MVRWGEDSVPAPGPPPQWERRRSRVRWLFLSGDPDKEGIALLAERTYLGFCPLALQKWSWRAAGRLGYDPTFKFS